MQAEASKLNFKKFLRTTAFILFFVVYCIVNFYICGIVGAIIFNEISDSLFAVYMIAAPIAISIVETTLFAKKVSKKQNKAINPEDQAVIDNFSMSVDAMLSTPRKRITPEEYAEIRQAEHDWLEAHYDFSTVESINAIPERKDLPRPPGGGPTGDVYYYLKYKTRIYESEGKIDLAIACMRKSISLMQLKYGDKSGKEECYSFVRMLARNGYSEEARTAKAQYDAYYDGGLDRMRLQSFQIALRNAADLNTDFLIMTAHRSACPECAKYQGRVYSISGKSKKFPPLPAVVKETGIIHPGCHHSFFPYTHNVSNPHMDQILQAHPLQKPRYGRNIVVFSNRPFVDDRSEECKQAAEESRERRRIEKERKRQYEETMVEREEEKRRDYAEYNWLKANFPDKCPASPSGYRRMKNQNTKNYQKLKQMAASLGKEL